MGSTYPTFANHGQFVELKRFFWSDQIIKLYTIPSLDQNHALYREPEHAEGR